MTTPVKFCPWCGQPNDINATMCGSCGRSLAVQTPPRQVTQPQTQVVQPRPAVKVELTYTAKMVRRCVVYLTIITAVICAAVAIFGIWVDDTDVIWKTVASMAIEIISSGIILTVSQMMRDNDGGGAIIAVKNVCVWVNIFATLFFSFIAIISLWFGIDTSTAWKAFGSIGVIFLATLTTATIINYLPERKE